MREREASVELEERDFALVEVLVRISVAEGLENLHLQNFAKSYNGISHHCRFV